jgi:hypothetical protein
MASDKKREQYWRELIDRQRASGQTVVEFCTKAGVWPYLTDVLRRLPTILPTDTAALERLLPDRWAQIHPEQRLTEREEESREAQARCRRKRAARRAAASA